ncbi:unnamed protein product, partial [Protopolystoma xenopodis]
MFRISSLKSPVSSKARLIRKFFWNDRKDTEASAEFSLTSPTPSISLSTCYPNSSSRRPSVTLHRHYSPRSPRSSGTLLSGWQHDTSSSPRSLACFDHVNSFSLPC